MDHNGIFAKDFNLLEKTLPIIVDNWGSQKPTLDKNILIGIPEGSYLDLSKPHVLKQYLNIVQRLGSPFHVKKVELVNDIANYNRTIDQITFAELYNVHSGWYEKYKELYRPMSRQSIEAGIKISPKNLALLLNKAR